MIDLNAATLPLWGSRLIEASAGTGKTWTIAALYLRLILGHGGPEQGFARALNPSEILVMTFTRAATRELSDRIRQRLLEAAHVFRDPPSVDPGDAFLRALLDDFADDAQRQHAAWRLALAAQGMDDAAIYTIDAWCQRSLREHAFDSGSLFDEQLVAGEQALLQDAAQDYWRQQCYPLDPQQLAQVLAVWNGLEALHQDLPNLLQPDNALANDSWRLIDVIGQAQAERERQLAALRAEWVDHAQAMRDFVQQQDPPAPHGWNGRRFAIKTLNGWLDTLADWAAGRSTDAIPDLKTGWSRFTPAGLQECRNDGTLPELPPAFAAFARLLPALQALPNVATAARRHAGAQVAQRLQVLKSQAGSFGFADMLQRLHLALQGDSGQALRQRLLAQYPVALVDEFQDTSPLQYGIFDRIYRTADNAREAALLLIGDPKQSIYGFRGADIYSYLQARQATAGRHYVLRRNYRASKPLMDAVNHCFARAEAHDAEGAFRFRSATQDPLPYVAVSAQGRAERWVDGGGARPAMTLVHDLMLQDGDSIRRLFAERCGAQIVQWLNDPDNGFADTKGRFERLRPKDIAVLVRTGKEAAAVRRALQRRGVASVYLSDKDSVFHSDEARDLVHWLRAVATPQDVALVRAALALPSVDLGLPELAALLADDEAFDAQIQQLRELQQVWLAQGVLAMLRQSLHRFALAGRWLRQDGGERRLTNFLHLAELLQNASRALDGEQALIRWLQQQIETPTEQNDEQVLRLESDDDLVKVVTVHKSKGLEYPVVCLPFGASFREITRQRTRSARLPAEDGTRRLVLDLSEADLQRADLERLREDLRLLYVAMTRPRHGLWLGFASTRVGTSSKCQSRKSALGCLLGGSGVDASDDWLPLLQQLAEAQPAIALIDARNQMAAATRLDRPGTARPLAEPLVYCASFDRQWSVASYSRLTRDLKTPQAGLSPFEARRPADDEGADAPADEVTSPAPDAIWHRFQRGPLAGNFLHEQLEWLAADGFALDRQPALAERLRQRCAHAGHEVDAEALVDWLQAVVQTPLPGPDAALAELHGAQAEMEFWLPAQSLQTGRIDQLCQTHLLAGIERPRLQNSHLHGMLMGFCDLVFEHAGRYWVLDYKSNHLGGSDGDYSAPALAAAMATHRYDVQAAIYLLALHRLLRSRLGPAYDPARQLGGAVYLFLRGIHGPARGVCRIDPVPELLDALDAMLATPEPLA